MKSLGVFFKDMGATIKNPKVFIPILVVLFIPVLYSGMFLTAFWDPYGKMNELPVAVVNEDQGAQYEGKSLKAGEDLVAELKKSDDFAWKFVNRKQAEEGMDNNDYYMTIVIPDNFSAQATTLMDEEPAPAQLVFEPNEGYNFLAAQIGGTAVKEIKAKVSAKVTEAYTDTLFDQVEKISGGLSDAGSGASTLNDGAVKLDDGAKQLKENLAKLVDGTIQLQDGVAPLAKGTESLYQGINEVKAGADGLAGGLTQLESAGKQLETGAADAHKGGMQLQAGLQSSLDGAKKLQAGLESSAQGSAQLQAGLESSVQGSAKVAEGAKGVAQGLEQLAKANPELAKNAAVQQLLAASQAVAQGSAQLHQGNQQLLQGSENLHGAQQQLVQGGQQLAAGQEQLLQGAAQLTAGQGQLASGLELFGGKLSEAAAGGQKLASGAGRLSGGAKQLLGGVEQLSGGVSTLADGSKQLDAGAGELKDGMDQLAAGSGELAAKLTDAADQTSGVKKTDALVNMYVEPISISEQKVNEVPNYGTGFAPYFLSLGLFVGALISTLVVPVRGSSVAEASGWNRFVSRTLAFTGMSLFQSLLAVVLVLYGLGLEVKSVPLFYLFSFITSLCYMFIIQALVTWLENPGRFLAILMLIFQLTTSAGTFPLELIPNWMKTFNPLLPMTYSVKGYKAVVSTGDLAIAWENIGVLAAFGVVFLAITLIYFARHQRSADVSPEASLSVQSH
ncbi:YhgE/Pip family protein [Paenibacillus macerans]|uniref:YhgE/Pip family protein n=1 Tax=Paenibacillus macerans TaxID=44252 RepID=UPI003D31E424